MKSTLSKCPVRTGSEEAGKENNGFVLRKKTELAEIRASVRQ